ncbi:MAG: L-aspartate oxidase, partial [Deltaproteobacteria bacterium]|nr:L-aspartate oxidase [Deltaproteobacteria bacterium]
GVAGLSAAIQAANGGSVLIVTKARINESCTEYAQGGIAAGLCPDDSFEEHINDTLRTGQGLCDDVIVNGVIREGSKRVKELIDWGAKFDRENGDLVFAKEGGHSHPRILRARGDSTGKEIEDTFVGMVAKHPRIRVFEHTFAIDLLVSNNTCNGIIAWRSREGKILIRAKQIILASGGCGQVYRETTNPEIATGDGIAMAYRAGATIANMEFYQFHPTCLYHPYAKSFLITEAMRGEGAILKDVQGNEFMEYYHPQKELAPRDVVSRAIDAELKRSGDDHVYLDIASYKNSDFIKSHFPGIYNTCLDFNIDITKQPIPVVPAAHYCCGGVKTEIDGTTEVKNLYVIGESACTGFHGANRLASNSLLEGVVTAYECANSLTEEIHKLKIPEFPEWEPGHAVPSTEAVVLSQNWDEIRRFMWNYVGIVRTDKRLQRAKKRINMLLDEIDQYYWDFKIEKNLVELRNLATVAKILIVSAISRKESRGIHYNIDHPYKSEMSRNTTIKRPW